MIKRLMPLLVVFAAVCAFAALAAGSASATPVFLPVGSKVFPLSFTSEGGVAKLNTVNHEVECTSVHNIGTILPQPNTKESMLGDVQFDFLGCVEKKAGNVPCSSGKLSTKLILTPEYLWHLGKLITLSGGTKDVLFLILVSLTQFNCGIEGLVSETVDVKGHLIGLLHAEYGKETNTATVSFEQEAAGSQKYKTFEALLPEETITGLDLTAEIVGSGKPELASEEASGTITTDGNVILDG